VNVTDLKNRTAPSDDELEMLETLRDSNIKDFSWTLASPKKDVLSSGRYSGQMVPMIIHTKTIMGGQCKNNKIDFCL
jgi:hypothetical protein